MKESTKQIIRKIIEKNPELEKNKKDIHDAVQTILDCYKAGGKLLICGNGGSAADSEHMVGELMKGFLLERPVSEKMHQKIALHMKEENAMQDFRRLQTGLPAISLVNQAALQTAIMNDIGAELVFAQQVLGYGKEGDVFVGISTSGNSSNVVKGACVARALKMKVIAMTGENKGSLADTSDILIDVPARETWEVQEYHLPVYHGICAAVENELFGGEIS